MGIGEVKGFGRLSGSPGQLLEMKTIIDNATSPNIDKTSVIGFVEKLFGCNVRFASAKTG